MQPIAISDVTDHQTCVQRVPIFSPLTREQQALVATFARPVQVRAGELLLNAGDHASRLFVVHTGAVKLVHTTEQGRSRVVRVVGPGETLGEHAFLTGARPEFSVEALEDTSLCTFDHVDLRRLVEAYPAIANGVMRSLSGRLQEAERRLSLAAVDVPSRVAAYVLELPASYLDGEVVVVLPWAKKDIASWLATTPESFSRALARLQKQGVLAVAGQSITLLDIDALEELATR